MKNFKAFLFGRIRIFLLNRGRKRSSTYINRYTKNLYPWFDFSKIVHGENEHILKWKVLNGRINPLYYRLYSTISGNYDINFIPDDIYIGIVLPLLNKPELALAYSEKNIYDIIYEKGIFPKCIIRNNDGVFLDYDYNKLNIDDISLPKTLEDYSKIIIKPTIDSTGGKNVNVFSTNTDKVFISTKNEKLTTSYLRNSYSKNFVIQEYIEQHDFFAKFNQTSLNTLRVMTYRSVLDEKIKILSIALRVGAQGAIADNLNNGGFVVKVNELGFLADFAINKKGDKVNVINEIDLKNEYEIPFYIECIERANFIASKNIHHRLLGLDITVDNKNKVRVIEINNGHIGTDLPHLVGLPLFGCYTDEIIDYCKSNIDKLNYKYNYNL